MRLTRREELSHIRGEIERHDDVDRASADEGLARLELVGMALELWEVQEPDERRRLLDFLCSNCEFHNDHLVVQFKKPYDGLVESLDAANANGGAFDESSAALPVWRAQEEPNSIANENSHLAAARSRSAIEREHTVGQKQNRPASYSPAGRWMVHPRRGETRVQMQLLESGVAMRGG